MGKIRMAALAALWWVVACTPEMPGLDDRQANHGQDASTTPSEGGVRVLTDVAPPPTDGAKGRDVAHGADDAAGPSGPYDGAVASDARSVVDARGEVAVADARAADRAIDGPDAIVDSRWADADVAPDAKGATDRASDHTTRDGKVEDRAEVSDGSLDVGIVLGTCTAVRACARGDGGSAEGCLRGASVAARAAAENVLACEAEHCASHCRAVYRATDCNACLLRACSAALATCARQSGCGDGIVTSDDEECDDGNVVDTDVCTSACTRARCGDGMPTSGTEECDDGNEIDTDACRTGCRRAGCGDGVVWAGIEGCDDGNRTAGDGCSAACLIETCGNAIVDPGEECDEGAANRREAPCLATCRINRCGDGQTCSSAACGTILGTLLETCDDGNGVNTDACVERCRAATCGDGYVREGVERCDDGNADPFDGCGLCATSASHLVVTEVVTRPAAAEMIEIFNPTHSAVALSSYAISDSHLYYEVAGGTFATANGTDFAAHFPDGAVLAPGGYAVVALGNASGGTQSFVATYGKAPDFELRPTANQATDDPAVPNMVAAAGGSIGASASLTDGGEPVILFILDGAQVIHDVDYLYYGAPSASNPVVDKTGIVSGASTYLPDTPESAQRAVAAPGEAGSIQRCVYAESSEKSGGGNGIGGHDETSEDATTAYRLSATAADRTPGAAPPAALCAASK
jgi:cysteine-rich repeat protein